MLITGPTEAQLDKLARQARRVQLNYVGSGIRKAAPGRWYVSGDRVVVEIDGQAPASINIRWGIKSVEVLEG